MSLSQPSDLSELASIPAHGYGPLPRSPRYHSLDHWRGIACVLIVIYHSTTVWKMTPHGRGIAALILLGTRVFRVGVPMFFVISGYCISATADSSRRKQTAMSTFFKRRFHRIFPPYWCAIAFQALVLLAIDVWLSPGLLTHSVLPVLRPWTFNFSQWVGNLTLTEIWRSHVAGGSSELILGQAWTLCFEEQFYFVIGLALLLFPRHLFKSALAVTGMTLLCRHTLPSAATQGFFFGGPWLMFAAGIGVYWAINYGSKTHGRLLLVTLAVACVYAKFQHDKDMLAAFAYAGLIFVLHPFDQRIVQSPIAAPLAISGHMCYSLYLTHAPFVRAISQAFANRGHTGPWITLLVMMPLAVITALAVGWVFYLLVERRFLNRPVLTPPVGTADMAAQEPITPLLDDDTAFAT